MGFKKRVLGVAAVAAAGAAAIAPAGASAATVATSGGFMSYSAAPYQTNNLQVTVDSQFVTFSENNSDQVTSAPGCVRYDWGTRCALAGVYGIRVYAGNMHDQVIATLNGATSVTLYGGDGNDQLDVTGFASSRAFINGENGDDRLYGRQFGDTVYGGAGNDLIQTGGGVDSIDGGPGADTIDAGSDNDFVYVKDSTKDTVNCGTGDSDWVQHDRTWWGGSLDALTSCERRSS